MKNVLITGAAGKLGKYVASRLRESFTLVLTDINSSSESDDVIKVDIGDTEEVNQVFGAHPNIDTVLHFGARPSGDTPWEEVLYNNIIGTKNIYEAAAAHGVKRVVFASSAQVIEGYPMDTLVTTNMLPRPRNFYGTSKAYGETLGRYYSDQRNLSVLCIRFGRIFYPEFEKIGPREMGPNYFPEPQKVITNRDALQLVQKCVDASPELRFGIFHGLSKNTVGWLDLSDTMRILGYKPQDNAYDYEG